MSELLAFLSSHQADMLEDLRRFVEQESPSDDKGRLDGFARFLARHAESMTGGRAALIANPSGGDHVRIELGSRGTPILLVGHFDTVWPVGTLERLPFAVHDGMATGPGSFDMKAGLVQGFWALRALREVAGFSGHVVFFCNSDEELGSPTSRDRIEAEASAASTALILEPSQEGSLKTARKGVGIFHLEVNGRAAHAGLDPFAGVSAIDELARLILDLHAITSEESGVTVNVGAIRGGTRSNVTAADASAEIDLRVVDGEQAGEVTARILGLRPHNPEAAVRVTGGMNRPPMERTERTVELFQSARGIARELGFDLGEVMVGGGSDGNFTAAFCSTLDGLGAVGGGAHADDERVSVTDMPRRAALVAHLIQSLA